MTDINTYSCPAVAGEVLCFLFFPKIVSIRVCEMGKFEQVLVQVYPFKRMLCQLLTARDICILCLTSRKLRDVFAAKLERALDVNLILKKFVDDPSSFRMMMRDTGAVVSGEFVRRMLLCQAVPDKLELVMMDAGFCSGAKFKRWVRYLRGREGYRTPSLKGDPSSRAMQVWFNMLTVLLFIDEL